MLDYFSASNYSTTLDAFKSELPNGSEFVPDPKAKWAGLLEKKWTSVIRLQKKVPSQSILEPYRGSGTLRLHRSWTLRRRMPR